MSGFWARRRAAVAEEAMAGDRQSAAEAEVARRDAVEAQDDGEVLAALDLPLPEDTDDAAVLRRFLTETVPQRLKQRALRRMWRLNPVLANLDGLNDYDGDYTDAATVVPGMKTAYQVGRGMLKALQDTPAPVAAAPVDEIAPEPEVMADVVAEAEDMDAAPVEMAVAEAPAAGHDAPAGPRRMRFSFGAEA